MARKRKTESERRAERAEATAAEWALFRPRLASVRTFKDALVLASEAPAETSPGRKYYSNLGFFLSAFRVPMGSSAEERALYLALFERFEREGALTPEVRAKVEAAFRAEMART